MTTTSPIDRMTDLERKIDVLTTHVEFLTIEARAQQQRRVAMEELQADITPIATKALERASSTLDASDIDPDDVLQLGMRVAQNAALLERSVAQIASLAELAEDLQPIVTQTMQMATDRAAMLEERGYFEFVDAAAGVVDRVVTSYDKEDVEALGDNIVQILDIIKDLTQPEVLEVAQRLLDIVQRQSEMPGEVELQPPSLFSLAGRLRDPEIRRGMGRALDTLEAVSTSDFNDKETNNHTQGGG